MKLPKMTVIGGGQMAQALLGGMISREVVDEGDLCVVVPSESSQVWWRENFSDVCVVGSAQKVDNDSAIVLLAVKPHVIPIVLANPEYDFDGKLVISIAAGVPLEKLIAGVNHARVIRVMPNTPSLLGEGASAFCVGDGVTRADIKHVETMLESVGYVAQVSEQQMDGVTGVSGSGPAYVFMMIEALADGGVLAGLPRKLALDLAAQTVLGAAKMVRETGEHPGVLKDKVCSPGGTTIAAVGVLERHGVRGAYIEAVKASADRAKALSN